MSRILEKAVSTVQNMLGLDKPAKEGESTPTSESHGETNNETTKNDSKPEMNGSGSSEEQTTPDKPEKVVDVEESSLDALLPNSVVTETMIEEEKKIEKETVIEDDRMLKESQQNFQTMEKEECYKRLQFLLQKSNAYTKYLLGRMEEQRKEDEVKNERLEKRRAKKVEESKEKEETLKIKQENGVVPDIDNNTSTRSRLSRSARMEAEKEKSPKTPKRGRRSRASNANSKTQEVPKGDSSDKMSQDDSTADESSQNTTSDDQSSQSSGNTKTKKRKASQLRITDVLDEQSLKKRLKTDENENREESSKNTSNEKEDQNDRQESKVPKQEEDPELRVPTDWKIQGQTVLQGQPALFSGGVMRKYQLEGLRWMNCIYENGVNGILADEMGLGKTIQCIAAISHLVSMHVSGPFLVVAPLSTLPNWLSEFRRFAPKVPVVLYHGSKEERPILRHKINQLHRVTSTISCMPVVLTSYQIAMNDSVHFQNFHWKYLIVDEGHRIKNASCRLIKELRMYHSTHRLLLTGTPLQNNMSELWSLLNYLLPEIFDDLNSFESWFTVDLIMGKNAEQEIIENEKQNNILSMLHQILAPFMLRRMKCDVDLLIPPKRELLVYAPLVKEQEEIYKAFVDRTLDILERKADKPKAEEAVEMDSKGRPVRKTAKKINYEALLDIEGGDDEKDLEAWVNYLNEQKKNKTEASLNLYDDSYKMVEERYSLNNVFMQLRKVSNHPYLIQYPLTSNGDYRIDEDLIKSSGKILLLERMLPELKKQGHKVLIFSQFTKMLNILEDYCYLKKYKYCRLDGGTSLEDRQSEMQDFNTESDIFIFLLSTRAGGLGINLTAADTVIIYDSDWNPQCDLQAQDRCHRIGQTNPVLVFRLITSNSIDVKIVERASAKRKLEKMVIHKGKFKNGLNSEGMPKLSPYELMELLQSKDHSDSYEARRGQVISKRDLEKLLDRRDLANGWKNSKESEKGNEKKKAVEDVEGVFKVVETQE